MTGYSTTAAQIAAGVGNAETIERVASS